jgi:predicted nucleic acid-binding protein
MVVRSYLVDTNVMLGAAKRGEASIPEFPPVLENLLRAGATLYYTVQNAAEFWNVFTRPREHNGFGLTSAEAADELAELETMLTLLTDSRSVYARWLELVKTYQVSGVQVHDARLVACMLAGEVSHLLTLNGADFARYGDLIAVVHPRDLLP